MFLKRIELAGFKSFADKTELEFVPGITAVVGPNGSGKSNISDAIRWVLGEQSAKSLRGGKMEDIIFAGSDSRKPVNYSEVSLTLDNFDQTLPLDFNEVVVTRRLHRNGDSEYYVNKQACRLRDITELFMDTGIGKEAYSIIGQGRIEEILSTRSEDRRGIFEEASGIVKYKSRKKEAQKKLDETEHNLLRIHDLLSELEGQIEPLQRQSEKANQFKQLNEQLKMQEISLYVYKIGQLYAAWSEESSNLHQLKDEQLQLSTVVSSHDAQLEHNRVNIHRIAEEVEVLQQSLLTFSEDVEKCEGHGDVLLERHSNLQYNYTQLSQLTAVNERRIAEKQAEQAAYDEKYVAVNEQLNSLAEALKAEELRLHKVNGNRNDQEQERLKAELLDLLNEMANTRNEIRFVEQQAESFDRRIDRLVSDAAKWEQQQVAVAGRRIELSDQMNRINDQLNRLGDEYVAGGRQLKSKEQLLEEAHAMQRKWEQQRGALISRRDTMREMQNDYDGFAHGVKQVLKAGNKPGGLLGIRGAIAELIKVPAEVEVAVEIALGGALQHVVVETEVHGRDAIAFLKQRQTGRATFLPMDVIKARTVSATEVSSIRDFAGFIGIAAELVQTATDYQSIVANLLGNVIIARSLEQANRIAAQCHYRYRVVTLEGDVVNAGGSMTGGSLAKKGAGLLGRARQIEQLDKEIAAADRQIAEMQVQTGQIKLQITEFSNQLENLRTQSERKRIAERELSAQLAQMENEEHQVNEQLVLSAQDRDLLLAERRSCDVNRQAANENLAKLEQQELQLEQSIRDAELKRKSDESAKEELQALLTELKIKTASVTQEKQSLQGQRDRMVSELTAANEELKENRTELERIAAQIEQNELDRVTQIEQLNRLKLSRQQCAEQLEFKRAERIESANSLEQEESRTRLERTQLRQTEQQLHQTEVQVNRLDVELGNLLEKLGEEYELSYELAQERYPSPEDLVGTQAAVRQLKSQIAALGEVNLGAIEEYARVYERFTFLTEQKDDLIEAKTTLYNVIREIDTEMSKRFRASFDAIRAQFSGVFARLFGGGKADLLLTDPDQPLETGIDIVAQPPGKRLQNLMLLSGGERALTAIALLFAILHVKPVPFCVLDEVEAALDEANVVRFGQYLREFSGHTQFIVVTHRKGTMEEADVLYGVTMEEGGVSKLVSVRLEDDEGAVSA